MWRVRALLDRRPALVGLGTFAVIAAVVRLADYAKPLGSDPGQFLYVGEIVAQGGMPYEDAAFDKGPLTALLFALIDPVVGISPTAVRLTAIPFAAAAALAIAAYVAHHAGRAAGVVAGVACAALSGLGAFEGAEAKTEAYGVAPMFGALWLATRRGPGAAAGCGGLTACAGLINPALALIALPVALQLWLETPRGERRRRYALALAGALAPVAVAAIWLAAGGALDDAAVQVGDQVREQRTTRTAPIADPGPPGEVYGPEPERSFSLPELRADLPAGVLWVMALAGCALAARSRRLRPAAVVIALALVAVLLRVKLPHYEFAYHYYPAVPALAGAIALGIASVWPEGTRARAALAAAVLAVPVGGYVVRSQYDLLREDPPDRLPSVAQRVPVADFLRDRTAPHDRVLVVGAAAEVYWRAQRRGPTRFFDVHGVTSEDDWRERNRDLLRRPPDAIAVTHPDRLESDAVAARLVRRNHYVRAYASGGSEVWIRP